MFFNHIVTGDESWFHCNIPTSKPSSLTWKHRSTKILHTRWKQSQKHRLEKWCCFLMFLGLYWSNGCPKDTTINARQYSDAHEIAQKHQKLSERKVWWDWHSRCWQHWNSKFSCIHCTVRILVHVIMKFLVHWRKVWKVNVFLQWKRSKKCLRNGCYKSG